MNTDEIKGRGLIFTGRHLPYNPRLLERAKELRKHMTPAEKKLWFVFLRKRRFRSQHLIDNYIADFYSPSLNLVIEIDGEQHYTEEGKTYDAERDVVLESYGLKVLRFTNTEVMEDFDAVCREISMLSRPPTAVTSVTGGSAKMLTKIDSWIIFYNTY